MLLPGPPFPVDMSFLACHRKFGDNGSATDTRIRVSMLNTDRLHNMVKVSLHSRVLAVVGITKLPLHVHILKEPVGNTNKQFKLCPARKNLGMANEGLREFLAKNLQVQLPLGMILKIVLIHFVRKHPGG